MKSVLERVRQGVRARRPGRVSSADRCRQLKAIRKRIASVKNDAEDHARDEAGGGGAAAPRAGRDRRARAPTRNALAEVVAEVALRAGADAHPLLDRRAPERRRRWSPLTSDRGLAALQRQRDPRRRSASPTSRTGDAAGARDRRARSSAGRAATTSAAASAIIGHELHRTDRRDRAARRRARSAHDRHRTLRARRRSTRVYLVYNEFKIAITQRVVVEPLLPIDRRDLPQPDADAAAAIDFLYEPRRSALLDALLPLYVESQIYRGLLESMASRVRRPHDRDGQRDHATPSEMIVDAHAAVQPRPPGGDHQGADGDRRRRRGAQGIEDRGHHEHASREASRARSFRSSARSSTSSSPAAGCPRSTPRCASPTRRSTTSRTT